MLGTVPSYVHAHVLVQFQHIYAGRALRYQHQQWRALPGAGSSVVRQRVACAPNVSGLCNGSATMGLAAPCDHMPQTTLRVAASSTTASQATPVVARQVHVPCLARPFGNHVCVCVCAVAHLTPLATEATIVHCVHSLPISPFPVSLYQAGTDVVVDTSHPTDTSATDQLTAATSSQSSSTSAMGKRTAASAHAQHQPPPTTVVFQAPYLCPVFPIFEVVNTV